MFFCCVCLKYFIVSTGCQCKPDQACMDNGTCCHEYCLGGCSGPGPENCYSCKGVTYQGRCRPECPNNTYKVSCEGGPRIQLIQVHCVATSIRDSLIFHQLLCSLVLVLFSPVSEEDCGCSIECFCHFDCNFFHSSFLSYMI